MSLRINASMHFSVTRIGMQSEKERHLYYLSIMLKKTP